MGPVRSDPLYYQLTPDVIIDRASLVLGQFFTHHEEGFVNVRCRFTFSGGTNVTLRGSTDPEWGWVDAHGQAVRFAFK